MTRAERRYAHGQAHPYDRNDAGEARPPADWAVRAARGAIADLQGRHTIKWGFDDVDEETRVEIVDSLAAIIRLAADTREEVGS